MTTNKQPAILEDRALEVLEEAKAYGKRGSYRDYETYKHRLYNLGLSAKSMDSALRTLSNILQV